MAYYNGFPATYQPAVYQPQVFQPQQPQQAQQGINWVQGEAGAKAYLVAPGCTVQLWDSEERVIYLKSADASGLPSMKILDYTIRGEKPEQKPAEYATKEDLEALEEKIRELKSELAGRKRTAKPVKEDEENE